MELPRREFAVVPDAKVRDYLLSPTHPVGRFKAAYFSGLGFAEERWEELQAALVAHAMAGVSSPGEVTPYGVKYAVRGELHGPGGLRSEVVSIWLLCSDDDAPTLITAYPG